MGIIRPLKTTEACRIISTIPAGRRKKDPANNISRVRPKKCFFEKTRMRKASTPSSDLHSLPYVRRGRPRTPSCYFPSGFVPLFAVSRCCAWSRCQGCTLLGMFILLCILPCFRTGAGLGFRHNDPGDSGHHPGRTQLALELCVFRLDLRPGLFVP